MTAAQSSPPTHPTASAGNAGSMHDFLVFKLMVTPLIIQIVFWVGAGLCVLAGLIVIIVGLATNVIMLLLLGLVYMVLGPLLVRIYCELIILAFRMNETLTEIRNIAAARP